MSTQVVSVLCLTFAKKIVIGILPTLKVTACLCERAAARQRLQRSSICHWGYSTVPDTSARTKFVIASKALVDVLAAEGAHLHFRCSAANDSSERQSPPALAAFQARRSAPPSPA